MSPITLLLIVLIVVAILGVPHWPYNANWAGQPWAYYPSGFLSLIIVILLILLLLGRI